MDIMTIKPKGYITDPETGVTHPILIMDVDEIMEREELRITNTTESLRARVLAHQATTNGHSESVAIH